jgi:hypothetical protein
LPSLIRSIQVSITSDGPDGGGATKPAPASPATSNASALQYALPSSIVD